MSVGEGAGDGITEHVLNLAKVLIYILSISNMSKHLHI